MSPSTDEPGWLHRMLAQAELTPEERHRLAEVLEALAGMLHRSPGNTDWPATLAHADRLAAADPRAYRGLAHTLRILQRIAAGPQEQRLRDAAELLDGILRKAMSA